MSRTCARITIDQCANQTQQGFRCSERLTAALCGKSDPPKTNARSVQFCQNRPSPGSRQASTPKKRGGSVAEIRSVDPSSSSAFINSGRFGSGTSGFQFGSWPIFREKQRGVENSGEGKTYHKTPSQKQFWTPPYDTFPPPRLSSPCCFP